MKKSEGLIPFAAVRFENELRVAIKKVEEGLFSSHAHAHFKSAQILDVLAPTGNFVLPIDSSNKKHYVAFAAGSGITPVISMLKTVLKEEPRSRFTLIYGNRNRSFSYFQGGTDGAEKRISRTISADHDFQPGENGCTGF